MRNYISSLFLFSHSQQSLILVVVLILDGLIERVQMSLIFIGEASHNFIHATSHLSSMQDTKCATCHLHLMHLANCQCMQPSTLTLCIS